MSSELPLGLSHAEGTPASEKGTVLSVLFHKQDTGWSVLKIESAGSGSFVVTGVIPNPEVGREVEISGVWIRDPNHGLQVKASRIIPSLTMSTAGLAKYLSSGIVKGLGPKTAQALVDRFGHSTLERLRDSDSAITGIRGFSPTHHKAAATVLKDKEPARDVAMLLVAHGIPGAVEKAKAISRKYGDDAARIVRERPYQLAKEIRGVGFALADKLAVAEGINLESPERASAALRHCLSEAVETGHCGLPITRWLELAKKLAPEAGPRFRTEIDALVSSGDVVVEGELYYSDTIHALEGRVAERLARIANLPILRLGEVQQFHQAAMAKSKIRLSRDQSDAVLQALSHPLFVLTGGPGVGKTTTLCSIVYALSLTKAEVALAAPTGKAAKRMSESAGKEASTLHRLLGFQGKDWAFGPDNPLPFSHVIVDEMSMCDLRLFGRLLDALRPEARLLLVGDVDQLPSIGPGRVLSDVIESGAAKVAALVEIQRQASGSRIIENAHLINLGLSPNLSLPESGAKCDFYWIDCPPEKLQDKLGDLMLNRIPKAFGYGSKTDIQVLVPKHEGPGGTKELNAFLQQLLNPGGSEGIPRGGFTLRTGDKVIQTRNNYEKNVFNGDVGIIESINMFQSEAVLRFGERRIVYSTSEFDEIQPAYAYSVHRSQGSEFPVVILPILPSYGFFFSRPLLYTGLTRAKKLAVLLGDRTSLEKCIQNTSGAKRHTGLASRLRLAIGNRG